MNDVDALYSKASVECGFAHISMYSAFVKYCEDKGVSIDSLLADGLHPNDNGYDVMFSLILNELNIAKSVDKIQ